jgi:acetyl-CoA carboxylase biotin carboxyl carrier protein
MRILEKMSNKFNIDQEAVRLLAQVLTETELTEIEYAMGDKKIRVARTPDPLNFGPMPSMGHHVVHDVLPQAAPLTDKAVRHPGAVESPMVGTAYLASEPGGAPFVQVGDQVTQGETLLIVEAMKVMSPISAPRSGKISQILVRDGSPVEFGEVLMILD